MTLAVLAVVASALAADGGTAIALDDGTVWLVYDGEWEELGGCEDGEVVELSAAAGGLEIRCGDGSGWSWSDLDGWMPEDDDDTDPPGPAAPGRSWWPALELALDLRPSATTGWLRLRWDY